MSQCDRFPTASAPPYRSYSSSTTVKSTSFCIQGNHTLPSFNIVLLIVDSDGGYRRDRSIAPPQEEFYESLSSSDFKNRRK
eukprot:7197346-Pyramimonas_sp.AAC.1